MQLFNTDQKLEEEDSFLIAEKNAHEEMIKNPLQNPIHEILSLKTKGIVLVYYMIGSILS